MVSVLFNHGSAGPFRRKPTVLNLVDILRQSILYVAYGKRIVLKHYFFTRLGFVCFLGIFVILMHYNAEETNSKEANFDKDSITVDWVLNECTLSGLPDKLNAVRCSAFMSASLNLYENTHYDEFFGWDKKSH